MFKFLPLLFLTIVNCQNNNCDYYNLIQPNENLEIYSNGYKRGLSAGKNVTCRYAIEALPGYKISTVCQFAFLFPFYKCQNSLRISRRGRTDLQDAQTYCGWLGKVSTTSLNNRMTIEFKTGSLPLASKFLCKLKAIEDECQCGKHNVGSKIVGGNESLVNEFPLMAAIVDKTGIQCGATIISNKVVVSAAHCFAGFSNWSAFQVIVGEHDITTKLESSFTKSYDINNVIIPQEFLLGDNNFDIALIFTQTDIIFNYGVSPSCLPFKFFEKSFTDEKVFALGWGTVEYAGPKSDVLRKVELTVIDDFICSGYEICTTATKYDTCQYDSGGAVIFQDPSNNLLYNIGIIRSGGDCGIGDMSYNIRITAQLDWILSKTMSTVYCVK